MTRHIEDSGIEPAIIIKREKDPIDDPEAAAMEVLGRVKVKIPGTIDESAWAWPLGFGGSAMWGRNEVPPIGALVAIFTIKGNKDRLYYIPGSHAEGQTFPEFVHPDITVAGDKNFRFVHDRREGQQYAAMQVIKDVDGQEDLICETRYDIEGNGMRIYATTGLKIETDGQFEIEAGGDVIINGRILANKPGNM
jgi:hypothetical protein